MHYSFDWRPIWDNCWLIADGLVTTVELSFAALILALLLGTLIGTLGASRARALSLWPPAMSSRCATCRS